VVVAAPVLSAPGPAPPHDRVIVVEVDPEDQVRRLKERDGRGVLEIRGILQAQDPLAEKAARADAVVDNRGSVNGTRGQVAAIWRELQHLLDQKRKKAVSP
jgi:dephospho-CoA kinase